MSGVDPYCTRTVCFACRTYGCTILNDSDFGDRKCPFFKTKKEFERDRELCRERITAFREQRRESW